MNETRLLFLCTGNSCRSQMAEGFARAKAVPGVSVYSAGAEPKPVHPTAVRAMAEVGIDISAQKSKSIDRVGVRDFDVVVTVCDRAAAACPVLPGSPTRLRWSLDDPAAAKGSEEEVLGAFRAVRDRIRALVNDLMDLGYLDSLAGAKRRSDLILDNISDGIIAHDPNRRIFHFNRAAERITGYSRDEVLNRDCWDVFPGGLCGGKCSFTNDERPVQDAFDKTVEIAAKDGERRQVAMSVRIMRTAEGITEGVLVSFRDLTQLRRLERRLGEVEQFSGIIGRDESMLAVFDLIRDLAESTAPVMIQGESGTGKELIAAAIHNEGPRAKKLFVPVNCGALPEGLLESELFGHVKGAFTGAIRDKKGRFELADGGTIFLDEIGDISPAMQVKLLRVLQEGHFERVGSEKTLKVDVRIISATNKKIDTEVAEGRFRDDLFYRLSVVPIMVPPLRDRRNDIPLLAENLLKRFVRDAGRAPVRISAAAMDIVMSYEWPGNVRELQNWLQFALVKCKGDEIRPEHLPPTRLRISAPVVHTRRQKIDVESVRRALERTGGNKVDAARQLGVSRATLYRFLDSSGILHPKEPPSSPL